jgi:hypothetical protein
MVSLSTEENVPQPLRRGWPSLGSQLPNWSAMMEKSQVGYSGSRRNNCHSCGKRWLGGDGRNRKQSGSQQLPPITLWSSLAPTICKSSSQSQLAKAKCDLLPQHLHYRAYYGKQNLELGGSIFLSGTNTNEKNSDKQIEISELL